ncbi:MAG: glycoside hydrolase family 32 protein [Lentisphaerae bacterium]|nr:glycoside hydrolase family 32 protein [Lentisphaerota bacterium]
MSAARKGWRFALTAVAVAAAICARAAGEGVDVVRAVETPDQVIGPTLHFRPASPGRYGDPIPFYNDGTYHVFYLLDGVGRMTWEHLASKDLVRWVILPRAIDAGPPGAPDAWCGTGSVVYDAPGQLFHLFYTGFNGANAFETYLDGRGHPDGGQQIMHAISRDVVRWIKQPQDTFVGDGVRYHNLRQGPFVSGNHMCRDPYVRWNAAEKIWDMVFVAETAAATGPQRPVFGRAVSTNLCQWRQVAPLQGARPGDCPDLFEIRGRWYLICDYARWSRAEAPEGPFGEERVFETGMLGVPKRMYDGRRHVLVGWIQDIEGDDDRGDLKGFGTQCLPRELDAGPEGDLICKPAAEVLALYRTRRWSREPTDVTAHAPLAWDAPADYRLDLTLTFDRFETDGECVVRLRDHGERTGYRIIFRPGRGQVEVAGPRYHYARQCHVDWTKPIKLQVFADGSIIESFINDAEAFSLRAYNWRDGRIALSATNADVTVCGAELRTLD